MTGRGVSDQDAVGEGALVSWADEATGSCLGGERHAERGREAWGYSFFLYGLLQLGRGNVSHWRKTITPSLPPFSAHLSFRPPTRTALP